MICWIFSVLNFHQLFPASFGWRTKRSVSTVFLRQGAPVILEKWELAETQKS